MPAVWVDYLEQDREIGVVWPDGSGGYTASPRLSAGRAPSSRSKDATSDGL